MTATGSAATAALVVRDALLLPVDDGRGGHGPWFHGWMEVADDGRIAAIGEGEPPTAVVTGDTTVLDVGGAMVAPGFVSAHSHLFTSGQRGICAGGTLYPWVTQLVRMLEHADAETMYWATLHGSLDFLANGITTAYNFTQSRAVVAFDPGTGRSSFQRLHPPEYLTRQFDGAADAGLRTVTAIRLDELAWPGDEALTEFDAMVAACEEAMPPPLHLGVSVMGAVQWASTRRAAELEVAAMRRHGITNQAHFVETAESIEVQRAKFGWYDDAGALGPDFLFGHFVHPTDEMVRIASDAGCGVVWQPTSNGRLGSGVADVVRLRDAGIRVGMGLDDQACTDVSDPWQNMRIGAYAMRALYTDASVMLPADVLRLHTLGSAEVLGVQDEVGSLEVGKLADFNVVDHRRPATGPVWDVHATYVLACGLRNLTQTYVGGRLVAEDGRRTSPLAARADVELVARMVEAAGRADVVPEVTPPVSAAS